MNIRLDGRVALITGATGGIGSAIATEFFRSGATVIINGRSQEKIDVFTNNLLSDANTSDSNRVYGIALDLSEPNSEINIIKHAIDKFHKIDILVNNAAIVDGKPISYSDEQFVKDVMLVNYQKPFLLTRNALSYMRKAQYGRIINITSLAGQSGGKGLSNYAASKAAMHSFSQTIACEYGKYNITANSIAPGFVETKTLKKIPKEYKQNSKKLIPCHRFATPSEVADLATFLASERASYINGQQIALNGGVYR